MRLYHKTFGFLFYLLCAFFLIYSYALVDPNITLINHPAWTQFRNLMVHFGYYMRAESSYLFIAFIVAFFGFHLYFVHNYKKIPLLHVLIPLGALGVFSYPLLSHDLFNYMFDAKILTHYHQNPYLHRALDFPGDPWVRFLHWTHRTYPYGPTFLAVSAIPSILSFGKFLLSFVFFKATSVVFYLSGVWALWKLNKKQAIFFATSPLVIIEGLVNAHNDLIAVSLVLIGVLLLFKKRTTASRLIFIASAGIKYITAPLIFLSKEKQKSNHLVIVMMIVIFTYLALFIEVQPWYFLALFALSPFYEKLISNLQIFFFGLLVSYYPYIRFGDWGDAARVEMKHAIIIVFLIINVAYLLFKRSKMKFFTK